MNEAEQTERDAARYRHLASMAKYGSGTIELMFAGDVRSIPACMPDVALGMAVDRAIEESEK